jgi:hypothetical protein
MGKLELPDTHSAGPDGLFPEQKPRKNFTNELREIAYRLWSCGVGVPEIAFALDLHEATIRIHLNHCAESGKVHLSRKPGRKSIIPDVAAGAQFLVDDLDMSRGPEITCALMQMRKCSRTTAYKALHLAGFSPKGPTFVFAFFSNSISKPIIHCRYRTNATPNALLMLATHFPPLLLAFLLIRCSI